MKYWRTTLLWIIIIVFVILWVPFFENVAVWATVVFFWSQPAFLSIYPVILFLGVFEGFLIALYVKSLIDSISKDEVKKFDL